MVIMKYILMFIIAVIVLSITSCSWNTAKNEVIKTPESKIVTSVAAVDVYVIVIDSVEYIVAYGSSAGTVAITPKIRTKDYEYHFNVDATGYDIYDEYDNLIKRIDYGKNPSLDSFINEDNL